MWVCTMKRVCQLWGFPKMKGGPNSWMVFTIYKGKSDVEMDDLGTPPFMETTMSEKEGYK